MSHSLGDLAKKIGADLNGDASVVVGRLATLEAATEGDISFFTNRRYKSHLAQTQASAVIIAHDDLPLCPTSALLLRNPYLGYAKVAEILSPKAAWQPGVHPSATVSVGAMVDSSSYIGPQVCIDDGVVVGADVFIGAGCVLGESCIIGPGSRLNANVTIGAGVYVGKRVILHSGAVIGADGFGLANDDGVWTKVPQLGGVRLGDDVEVGANTTIDRGALDDTVIGRGVKLDNLIQIAHNVIVGEHTAIAGCVGIAGSVKIGKRCTIGGAVAINGHIEICDDVDVTGGSQVAQSISESGMYSSGMSAQPNSKWRKMHARMRQLERMSQRLRLLEEKLEKGG